MEVEKSLFLQNQLSFKKLITNIKIMNIQSMSYTRNKITSKSLRRQCYSEESFKARSYKFIPYTVSRQFD